MRPLVNFLIAYSPDPKFRATLLRHWSQHADFDSVAAGPGSWVRAAAPLPLSDLGYYDYDATQTYCLGLAEGSENVAHRAEFARDLEHHPQRMGRYAGDISAVLITATGLTVMRSPCGLVPWYLYRGDDQLVVVSTRLAWFRRHLPQRFAIDAFAHAIATDGISCCDRRTPLRDVVALPVGHAAQIEIGGFAPTERLVRYWHPEALTPQGSQRDDAAERGAWLRQILIDRLIADLDPDGANLLGLSGGVDSSCLGALAVGPARLAVDAFTFLPAQNHPAFAEVDRFVQSIAERVRPSRHWRMPMDEQDSLACAPCSPPVDMPIPHPALCQLSSIAATGGVAVYSGGEAADDLFAGPFVLGKDWIENVSSLQLMRSLRRPWYGVARRFVAKQWLKARLDRRRPPLPINANLSALFRAELRDEYRHWIDELQTQLQASTHPYRHLLLFFGFDGWLRQNWEVCSELRVRRSLPFWCRDTIELALSTDPRIQALPPKRLIRLGMRNDVPSLNLDRPDKGAWSERNVVTWQGGELSEHLRPLIRADLLGTTPQTISFTDASLLAILLASTRASPIAQ